MTLKSLVESDFSHLKELNIKPVFVFSGLRTAIQYEYYEQDGLLPTERTFQHVWDNKINRESQSESFRDSDSPLEVKPLMDSFMAFLDSKNVEYIVSPYSALSQLQYMLDTKVINCIFASTDALLINNADKIILSMEFESKQFKYLEYSTVLSKLNLSAKQFKDVSMCVGNVFQPFSLNIFGPIPPTEGIFEAYHHFVLNGGSIYNTLLALGIESDEMSHYMKGCISIQFMPVLKVNGRVQPVQYNEKAPFLSRPPTMTSPPPQSSSTANSTATTTDESEKIPEDLYQVIGQRLPDEVFFYQSVGLTTFYLSEMAVHSNAIERLPLDMSVTPLYERLVTGEFGRSILEKAMNVMTVPINRYFQFKKLKLTTYFNGSHEYEIDQKSSPPVYNQIRPLIVRHTTARSFDLTSLLSGMTDDFLTENTVSSGDSNDVHKIHTNFELISTALLRTLTLYGFIDISSFKLTPWGELLSYVAGCRDVRAVLLTLFLFRQIGKLTPSDLIEPSDFGVKDNSDTDASILISKFLGIFGLQHLKPIKYLYRISRPLVQFRSVLSRLNESVDEVVTVNLTALLLTNRDDTEKYTRTSPQWRRLALESPFRGSLPSVLLGIVSEQFFEHYLENGDVKECLNTIHINFNFVNENPEVEFLEGLRKFRDIVGLVRLMKEKKIELDEDTANLFEKADKLISKVMEAVETKTS